MATIAASTSGIAHAADSKEAHQAGPRHSNHDVHGGDPRVHPTGEVGELQPEVVAKRARSEGSGAEPVPIGGMARRGRRSRRLPLLTLQDRGIQGARPRIAFAAPSVSRWPPPADRSPRNRRHASPLASRYRMLSHHRTGAVICSTRVSPDSGRIVRPRGHVGDHRNLGGRKAIPATNSRKRSRAAAMKGV